MKSRWSHPRVLVVDDDTELASLLQEILRGEGFDPIVAASDAPLASLMEQRPGLVLLDYVLRGRRDIVDAAKRGAFGRVPVILLSAVSDIEHRAKEIGASAFVAKPFDIDHLVRTCRATAVV